VAEYGGQSYSAPNAAVWTSGSSTHIDLDISFVTVSGSFTATENMNPIIGEYVYISAYREGNSGQGDYNVFLQGVLNYTWNGNICNWTLDTTGFSTPTRVRLQIWIGGNTVTEDITLGTTDETVPLKNYTFTTITLSGTIGTVTVNGQPPTGGYTIYALINVGSSYVGSSYLGNLVGGSNNWQISGIPGDFSGTLSIRIEVEYGGKRYQKEVGTWTPSDPVAGINLGDITITLNPIGGTVTTNGTTPLGNGFLAVVDQYDTELSALINRPMLGEAGITGGSFTGYTYVSSGYVAIWDTSNNRYYITPNPVSLNTSMPLNLTNMDPVTDDSVPIPPKI
jgi:hypothetical protein